VSSKEAGSGLLAMRVDLGSLLSHAGLDGGQEVRVFDAVKRRGLDRVRCWRRAKGFEGSRASAGGGRGGFEESLASSGYGIWEL